MAVAMPVLGTPPLEVARPSWLREFERHFDRGRQSSRYRRVPVAMPALTIKIAELKVLDFRDAIDDDVGGGLGSR